MPHQRMMSDETVKYLYSKNGGCLHDKSCPVARDIPDEELCCSKDYLPNISQCPLCAVKAYLRLGAKDFYNYPLYEKLFQRMRFTPALHEREAGIIEFENSTWLAVVQKATAYHDGRLVFTFQNGMEIEG